MVMKKDFMSQRTKIQLPVFSYTRANAIVVPLDLWKTTTRTNSSNSSNSTKAPCLDISKYNMHLSQHAETQIEQKGFDREMIKKTFMYPQRLYPSKSHLGQYRITGNGLCLVGQPDIIIENGKNAKDQTGTFSVITIYSDQVLTPPRPDQLSTPEGKRYAERFEKNLGRG